LEDKRLLREEEIMPGPVSDSYDPEFGTCTNADDIRRVIKDVVDRMDSYLGPELKDIVEVAQAPYGKASRLFLNEREMRVIRFSLNRALETI
jgi:hypothetical protein